MKGFHSSRLQLSALPAEMLAREPNCQQQTFAWNFGAHQEHGLRSDHSEKILHEFIMSLKWVSLECRWPVLFPALPRVSPTPMKLGRVPQPAPPLLQPLEAGGRWPQSLSTCPYHQAA